MKQTIENVRCSEVQDTATDNMLMEDPLAFIAEDHLRVKRVAETMRRIATDAEPSPKDLHETTAFLENELPLLMHDEDDDLLALLEPRVVAGDDYARLKLTLAKVHQAIEDDRLLVLARLKASDGLSTADRELILRAAKRLTEDMILENAKLLPLAKKRLTANDITTLRGQMVQRRIRDVREARDNAR